VARGDSGADKILGLTVSTFRSHQLLGLELFEDESDGLVTDPGQGGPHLGEPEHGRRMLEDVGPDALLLRAARSIGCCPSGKGFVGGSQCGHEVREPRPWIGGVLVPVVGRLEQSLVVGIRGLSDQLFDGDPPTHVVARIDQQCVRQRTGNSSVAIREWVDDE
jgi:hypothetical protein